MGTATQIRPLYGVDKQSADTTAGAMWAGQKKPAAPEVPSAIAHTACATYTHLGDASDRAPSPARPDIAVQVDISTGAVFVPLCVLGLLAAVLFSPRRAPTDRLVEIIKTVQGRS